VVANIEWLYKVVFEYKWFYFDLWSFVHLWSGGIFFIILTANNVKKRWFWLLLGLSVFEVVETLFFILVLNLFKPEKSIDIVTDIGVGMLGGYLMYLFFKWDMGGKHTKQFCIVISALTIAFIWVGSYGYNYNLPFFNSPFINWWALCCWAMSGAAIVLVFSILRRKMNTILAISVPWIIYAGFLLLFEYIAFHQLSFKEIGHGSTPLIFNAIHGATIMHVFYAVAPALFIGLYMLLYSLFKKYE